LGAKNERAHLRGRDIHLARDALAHEFAHAAARRAREPFEVPRARARMRLKNARAKSVGDRAPSERALDAEGLAHLNVKKSRCAHPWLGRAALERRDARVDDVEWELIDFAERAGKLLAEGAKTRPRIVALGRSKRAHLHVFRQQIRRLHDPHRDTPGAHCTVDVG